MDTTSKERRASEVVQIYDAKREPSPRPHFLSDWLNHPAGTVLALVDSNRNCYGFGRIRPCLLQNGQGQLLVKGHLYY